MQRQLQAGAVEDRAVLGDLDRVLRARVVEARRALELERISPRMPRTMRTMRCLSVTTFGSVGDRHEVDDLGDAVLGHEARDQHRGVRKVQLLDDAVVVARARCGSSRRVVVVEDAAKTLGESKRGQQNQSIVPSVATRAAVCRSPISPCSAIGAAGTWRCARALCGIGLRSGPCRQLTRSFAAWRWGIPYKFDGRRPLRGG